MDPAYLPAFENKMFIEGPETGRRLTTFFALLLLATAIATYGVLSNSTATVIGAMIVAPLMGPIMATAAAVVMGSSERAVRALALVAVGVVTVVVASYLLTLIVPSIAISFSSNGEITSRVNPGLFALLSALASGAAGAYITAREEISDAMGGVAIAISLVPPLCVVGIALSHGELTAARGAALLFATNFLCILLAGGIILWLSGISDPALTATHVRVRRRGLALIAVATLLIAVPLYAEGRQAVSDALDTRTATSEAQQWLSGKSFAIVSVSVNGDVVATTIAGSGDLPVLTELAARLSQRFGRPVVVTLHTVQATEQTAASGG
jgi:uncharacterized hydrophobic protein (TIGR00271 family)